MINFLQKILFKLFALALSSLLVVILGRSVDPFMRIAITIFVPALICASDALHTTQR